MMGILKRFQQYFSYILVVSHIGRGNGELVHRENHWSFTSNTNWQKFISHRVVSNILHQGQELTNYCG